MFGLEPPYFISYFSGGNTNCLYSTYDIRDSSNSVIFNRNLSLDTGGQPAYVENWSEVSTGSFNHIRINTGSYSIYKENNPNSDMLRFSISSYYPIYDSDGNFVSYTSSTANYFGLTNTSEYLVSTGRADGTESIFSIPISDIMVLNNDYMYVFIFNNYFVMTGLAAEDKEQQETDKELGLLEDQKDLMEDQKELLEEQNKTSKGIWDTIIEVVSYINPASENFFVYKLIDLLIDALKSLFVPDEEFLNTWISDMNDWISDRLGIVYYPVDLVIDFLTRIGNISKSRN